MQGNLKTAAQALCEQEEISVLTSGISMRPMLRQHKDIVVIKRTNGRLKKTMFPFTTETEAINLFFTEYLR